jgi:uncharacterized membrane protein
METLIRILLVLHILSGFTCFFVAPLALAVNKGGRAHRRWGKVFFWSMTGAAATALIMAPYKRNWFLTMVAVFSFYLAFSGYRSVYRKKVRSRAEIPLIDWLVAGLNALFCIGLFVLGISLLPDAFGYVSMTLGLIGLSYARRDLHFFRQPEQERKEWLVNHIVGMMGGYIAAVSAFSAVNFGFPWMPTVLQWLWPTLLGVPVILYFSGRIRRRHRKGGADGDLFELRRS